MTTQTTTQTTTQSLSEVQKTIIAIIEENPSISRKELSAMIGNITEDGIKYHTQKLQKMGVLRREGPDYGGKWVVLKEKN
ncbi:MAG: winged helix-turn-helix domain-containing protein [Candidatus Aphodosoma sp.]